MNMFIVAGIAIGLIAVIGIFMSVNVAADSNQQHLTAQECTSCGNSCSLESNCGLASCGAVTGGSCSCGD